MVNYHRVYKGYDVTIHENWEGYKTPQIWFSITKYSSDRKIVWDFESNADYTRKRDALKHALRMVDALVEDPELLKSENPMWDAFQKKGWD